MKILILCLIAAINGQSSEIYTCTRDANIASALQQATLIASFKTIDRILCLGACNRNPNCLSCSFNNVATASDDCYLYNRVFTSSEYSQASNVNWYSKRSSTLFTVSSIKTSGIKKTSTCSSSLMFYFRNTTQNSSIRTYNGITLNGLLSTEMAIVNNTPVYFLADWGNNALIKMSETWQYINKINTIIGPRVIKWANDHLYVSSDDGFFKMDYNFNIKKSIIDNSATYNGIYHNASDNTVVVAVWWRYRLDWIDADNMTVLANMNLGWYCPIGIAAYGGSLYVSASDTSTITLIYVIRNRVIINTLPISTSTATSIYSIVIDECGFMAMSFEIEGLIRHYHINGTSTGFNLTFPTLVYHINFDINRRMMISTTNALYFYN